MVRLLKKLREDLFSFIVVAIIFIAISLQRNKFFWGLLIFIFAISSIFLSESLNTFSSYFNMKHTLKDADICSKVLNKIKLKKADLSVFLMNFSAVASLLHIFYPTFRLKSSSFVEYTLWFRRNAVVTFMLIFGSIALILLEVGCYTAWKHYLVKKYTQQVSGNKFLHSKD